MVINDLIALGFSQKEALVYYTLLKTGPCAASTLARLTEIKRTSIYDFLHSLFSKNLINQYKKDNTVFYLVDDVGKISIYEKNKLNIAEKLTQELLLEQNSSDKIQISHYEGVYGYKEMYEQILKSKPKEFVGWGKLEEFYKALDVKYEKSWTKNRTKFGIQARFIVIDTPLSRKFKKDDEKFLRKTKLVSQKNFPFTTTCFVFNDFISFFDTTNDIIGIRISNPALAQMMKQIFEMNWKAC